MAQTAAASGRPALPPDQVRGLAKGPAIAPSVILVDPQLPENIGTAARAMMNCGLSDLRLVRPRPPWPDERAARASSGADAVLASARVFATVADSVADLRHVYATTGRRRDMVKPETTPRLAAREMRLALARDEPCGVLFGPERTGLENDDIVLARTLVAVPLNPMFNSLNLAQAVLIVGYEWYQAGRKANRRRLSFDHSPPATAAELHGFLDRLEAELDACGFLRNREMRPTMVRNIRNLFQRAVPTEQDVRTLQGVVTCLVGVRAHARPRGESV